MKNKLFAIGALILGLMIACGCDSPKTNETNKKETDKTKNEFDIKNTEGAETINEMGERVDVIGTYDFNGDGRLESCYLLEPKTFDGEDRFMECEGDCNCLIMFSDDSILPIEVESCIGGMPDVLGDLDGNGTIEIGIWPHWWTSCWHSYYIYTFVNGGWTFFVEPFSVHCNLMDELEGPIIEAVDDKKDMFLIKYSDFDEEDGIVTKTKKVKKLI